MFDRRFIIKTDHRSLKFLLEQRLSTPLQHTWLVKLIGYDYEIVYKKGAENLAADALSRMSRHELHDITFSSISSELLDRIKESISADNNYMPIVNRLAQGEGVDRFQLKVRLLLREGKIVVGQNMELRMEIITLFHASPLGRHSGSTVTMHRVPSLFYWKGIKRSVCEYVRNFAVCQ